MNLQNLILHNCLKNDEDFIAQITPDLFKGSHYEIARYIQAVVGEVTPDKVRALVNADKKAKHAPDILDEITNLHETVYAHYDNAVNDLKEEVMFQRVHDAGQILSKAGTDVCTRDDIERINNDIANYLSQTAVDEIYDFNEVATDVFEKDLEEITKDRLYLSHPMLANVFGEYLLPRLYVISGLPSMGKNIVLDNVVADMLKNKHGAYFSFDNNHDETVVNILSAMSGVEYMDIFNGSVRHNETLMGKIATAKMAMNHDLKIITRKMYPRQIATTMGKLVKQHDVGFMVLDYFQNIPTGERDKVRHLEDACILFKGIAQKYNMPVIILSQVNADGSTKWCKGLHEEAYFHLQVTVEKEEDIKTDKRILNREKFKKGARTAFPVCMNYSKGAVLERRT